MAEYSANYTQNTTSYTFGTETFKFSRTVDVINPSEIDNSCIYCGAENGSKYDYFPSYMLDSAGQQLMNSKWMAAGGNFAFSNSATDMPFNVTFAALSDGGSANEAGQNTVYQIGKTIYSKASSVTNSTIKILNPFDIRKLIFFIQCDGYDGTSMSIHSNVDIKYLMDNADTFFIRNMRITANCWNGSSYTNDSTIQKIRPVIIGEDFFLPINNSFTEHVYNMTDYNSRKEFTQSFFGAYDKDNMCMSILPILSDETEAYATGSGGLITANGNKYNYSYNNYNSNYNLRAPAKQVLQLLAYCGCYFMDGSYNLSGKNLTNFWNDEHIYLGEMKAGARTTGNFIKGTDLLTSDTINKGEYSSQTDFDPVPPPSGTDEDEDTAITTNGAPFGTGLAHYYLTTVDSLTLQHISEAMSTWDIDATKKDLYKNLISCKIIKPPAGIPSASGVFTIYGVKPQYNGADITITEVTGNPSITYGPYSISRKFNDFRDYAPYSKAEIFIPYCGWTALPSHCIGRSVYVDYFTDVIAGTVKAVIRCGNNVVAEAAGVMAVDVPFAADNVGAKVAAATTGMLSYGQGALQASIGIGQAVATKGKSGIKNITSGLASVIGAYNQMAMVNNENWTEINGKSGDGCALAGIDTIIIKITRPKYGSYSAPYYVPADYGHTVGFVAMKKTTVGSCTGLIICDNVDTSGISGATDRERQLIKEYLESGVIVKHPE